MIKNILEGTYEAFGFTCVPDGSPVDVKVDGGSAFFECSEGQHYLVGDTEEEAFIGLKRVTSYGVPRVSYPDKDDMAPEYKALAERVMALSGQDNEVNADIAYAVGWRVCNGEWYSPSIVRFAKEKKMRLIDIEGVDDCPNFTGSFAAAAKLVDRRWRWEAQSDGPARVIVPQENQGSAYYDADGATPALALAAAALLALAEQVQHDTH